MRITYVAKHDSGGNDDEGAILHALRRMGHEVEPLREVNGHRVGRLPPADLLLFHKWADFGAVKLAKAKVRAFWYFDLVDWPDPEVAARCAQRRQWMEQMIPQVDLGFCTDGDWVRLLQDDANGGLGDSGPRLVHLPQGFDERLVPGVPSTCEDCGSEHRPIKILFVGRSDRCGAGRRSFVEFLRQRYGPAFHQVADGVHGQALAELVARSRVVVAPDAPATDSYWSNRIFLMLGLGACLLHPRCQGLRTFYEEGNDYMAYDDRQDLVERINYLLETPGVRRQMAQHGRTRTMEGNRYYDRCLTITRKVTERLAEKVS